MVPIPGAAPWIIEGLKRTCDKADTRCRYIYEINTQKAGGTPYYCEYVVTGKDGKAASKSPAGPVTCEVFTVTHNWIDDNSDGIGYTLIMPVHAPTNRIIYAGYDDYTLDKKGTVVADKEWTVEYLPGTEPPTKA